MSEVAVSRSGWFGIISSAATAVVVGFASTILLIMQAAQAVGATPSQQASWAAVICFGMAATTLYLSWAHKVPIITAWSTPGAALIATSAAGITYENALGAFVVAGLLMCLTALVKPLARAIAQIPAPIAAAMLAGVLLKYTLGVPAAALSMPLFVLPLIIVFFALRLSFALFAVPVVVVLGVAIAGFAGTFSADCCVVGITQLEWTTPQFDGATILSLGVPLFLVTMASQNLPGVSVIRASGYDLPISRLITMTGLATLVLAPFGAFALNFSAITAAICMGPEAHEDRRRRYTAAVSCGALYVAIGLFGAVITGLLTAFPKELVVAIAGLALLGTIGNGLAVALQGEAHREAALITFLVTLSGVVIAGVGSAFWGVVAGSFALFVQQYARSPDRKTP